MLLYFLFSLRILFHSSSFSLEGLTLILLLAFHFDLSWEGLGAGGEGDDWGWDGWMASRTRWTWVWVNSGSWWWTGRLGVLRFMGSQRVGHDWATELNRTILILEFITFHHFYFTAFQCQLFPNPSSNHSLTVRMPPEPYCSWLSLSLCKLPPLIA